MIWFTAFLTGFLGSLHCAGMCGPLAFALPGRDGNKFGFISGRLIYNGGRILTYTFLGLFSGFAGETLQLAGVQQYLSLISGALILGVVLIPRIFKFKISENISVQFPGNLISKLFNKPGKSTLLGIGILNGLLPCGLVYVALAAALSPGSIKGGALFMALFGLGTLPMMFFFSVSKEFLSLKNRFRLKNLSPYFGVLIGVLFIIRGAGLGIPYLSPELNKEKNQIENCCKPTR